MKRVRAICCAVLAGLMLAGCAVQPQTDNKRGGGAAVDLTKYVVKEAAYRPIPKSRGLKTTSMKTVRATGTPTTRHTPSTGRRCKSWASSTRRRTAAR